MTGDSVTWIGCAQAEELVNDLIGDHDDQSAAYLTLLEFTKPRLVKICASKIGLARIHTDVPNDKSDLVNDVIIGSVDGEMLISGLARLYKHGADASEFINFKAGAFKFHGATITDESGSALLLKNWFEVFGLRFSREDILRHFDASNHVSQSVEPALPAARPPVAASAPATSTALAELECAQWLKQEFSESAAEGMNKKHFSNIARTKFQDRLSERGFLRAWDLAKQAFPDRSLPGRKSTQRIDTPV